MNDFLPIYDLTPFTMLDFPDRIACIIWFSGCNMRCQYCHNPEIVKGKSGKLKAEDVLSFLRDRRGLLEGVVLSGGEATLYEGIIAFARTVKKMGYAIKLDTNGTRPDIIRRMLDEDLLNYVALDYKAPAGKFKNVTGLEDKKAFDTSLNILCRQLFVPMEVRTTVHTSLLDEGDIMRIVLDLKEKGYRGKYYLQNFRSPITATLGKLCDQSRQLQFQIPVNEIGFSVGFRNF
jgi:pyruvate formate lyase activating enzyme